MDARRHEGHALPEESGTRGGSVEKYAITKVNFLHQRPPRPPLAWQSYDFQGIGQKSSIGLQIGLVP